MNNVGFNFSAYANVVTPFSPLGKQAVGQENAEAKEEVFAPVEQANPDDRLNNDEAETENLKESRQTIRDDEQSSREQQQQQREDEQVIRELAARDREVRAHEQAHASVGGQYAGSPSFTFKRGPDGVSYAVGGEVPISLPGGGDPEQRAQAAEQVRRAALAPADPSSQDRRVAAAALQVATEARAELATSRKEQQGEETDNKVDRTSETETDDKTQMEADADKEAREQRRKELRSAAFRNSQLQSQLITQETIQRSQSVGSVFNQQA